MCHREFHFSKLVRDIGVWVHILIYFICLTRKRLIEIKNLFYKSVLAKTGSSKVIHTHKHKVDTNIQTFQGQLK